MKRLAILIFAYLAVFVLPAAAEKKVALVIGNSDYQHAKPLPNPNRDAKAISRMLEGIGFTVISGTDLTRQGMAEKIREFSSKAVDADTVLYFYAGHGIQLEGQNYLIPVDADLNNEMDVKFSTLDIDLMLQQTPPTARVKLVLLDACRDNPFKEQIAQSVNGTRSVTIYNGLAEMKPSFGTLIAYATGPGEVAYDGNAQNSPFTSALLKYLPAPGLEIGQAMTRVRASVYEDTNNRQLPWENKNLTRDYYLVPAVTIVDPDATATVEDTKLPFAEDKDKKSWTEDNAEIVLWQAVKDSKDPSEIQAYLDRYGETGIFSNVARKRIASLSAEEPVQEKPVQITTPANNEPMSVKPVQEKSKAKPVTRKLAPKTESKPVATKSTKKKKSKVVEQPVKTKKKATTVSETSKKKKSSGTAPKIGIGIGIGTRSGIGVSFGF